MPKVKITRETRKTLDELKEYMGNSDAKVLEKLIKEKLELFKAEENWEQDQAERFDLG